MLTNSTLNLAKFFTKMAKYGKKSTATQSNSGTTITNSAPNGFGSGVANQHWVLHVISQLNFYHLKGNKQPFKLQ